MDFEQVEDEEVNEARRRIYYSDSEYKKRLLDKKYVNEVELAIKGMPESKIREIISKKIKQIKEGNISEKEIEKLECELAILITNLPINLEDRQMYWEELEENARKNKQ